MRELTPVPCAPCTCTDHDPCVDRSGSERTRYYHRQLVGPEDLTQDQVYFRERLRRHNRIMHGWGVVCGAPVEQTVVIEDGARRLKPFSVTVGAAYILGPYGDEIIIDRDVCLDIQRETMDGLLQDPCGARPRDPWCIDVQVDREPDRTYYLAIKWAECEVRPVRAATGCGCGCEDAACEYSRIRDGFALALLDELPWGHTDLPTTPFEQASGYESFRGRVSCAKGSSRDCPECPQSPWVVLADIVVKADGTLTWAFSHRRYVASFGSYVFACPSQDLDVSVHRQYVLGEEPADTDAASIDAGKTEPATLVRKTGEGLFEEHGGDLRALMMMPLGLIKNAIPPRSPIREALSDIPLGEFLWDIKGKVVDLAPGAETSDIERAERLIERVFAKAGFAEPRR